LDISAQIIGNSPVRQAIAEASSATGTDFGFLLATAARESSMNPRAEARTSSATGLFQFLDQSWLTTLKRHGAKHGLGNEANLIEIGADGRAYVDDPKARRMLLDMRYDAKTSALMAAEFSRDNSEYIKARTGIEPQAGDLYAAHFLGAAGASTLINAAQNTPWLEARDIFPAAANANRPVFYQDGRALSVAEVLDNLRKTTGNSNPAFTNAEMNNSRQNPNLMMAQLQMSWNNSLMNMLSGGVGNEMGATNSFSPQMLAQFYQMQDDTSQAKAMEIVSNTWDNGSLAKALLPDPNNEVSNKDIDLRGRK
jgi:hypothetical protein